jgi:hypothetical protein
MVVSACSGVCVVHAQFIDSKNLKGGEVTITTQISKLCVVLF